MLTYADVCCAHAAGRACGRRSSRECADVCRRMLTYAARARQGEHAGGGAAAETGGPLGPQARQGTNSSVTRRELEHAGGGGGGAETGGPLGPQARLGTNSSVTRRELFRGLAAEDDVVLAVFSQPFKIDARVLSVWLHALLAAPAGALTYADVC